MNLEAVFHDECNDYLNILEPDLNDELEIKIRIAKDEAIEVFLLTDENKYKMAKIADDEYFDYYSYKYILDKEIFKYSFYLKYDEKDIYYSKIGISQDRAYDYEFKIIAGFKTPDWSKGAIIYQIFIDRFNRSENSFNVKDDEYIYIGKAVKNIEDWEELPQNFDVHRFYGGNLQGVWDKIDYLLSLGVEVIYFNPLFVSPSNHKYDAQDYDYIDPHLTILKRDTTVSDVKDNNDRAFSYIERTACMENLNASNEFFAKFMDYAHKKGLKIILDGVFNHCGSFHKWLDREKIYQQANQIYNENYDIGAFNSLDSKYRDYFYFEQDTLDYQGWWGHKTLPKLNYENSKELMQNIFEIAKKWIKAPYNIDGWRLDVAADIGRTEEFNHFFFKKFREEVKKTNKDTLILAEHYGDPSSWLDGKQWDTVMNYDAFMEPITWFLTGLEKHSDRKEASLRGNSQAFLDMLRYNSARFPMPSLLSAMNELSNHDHSRFLTRTNFKVGRIESLGSEAANEDIKVSIFRQAIMMQMSLIGAPTIYYGDEAGLCGFTDPDNRRTYPWGKEDYEILMFYRYLALLHKHNICLKLGSFIPIMLDENFIVYARTYNKNKAVVVIYTGSKEKQFKVPIYLAGIKKSEKLSRFMYSDENGHNAGRIDYNIEDKYFDVEVKENTCILYIVEA